MRIAGREVRGLLIDLDGVLYVGQTPLPGAVAKVNELADRGVPCCFLTNTTTRSRHALHDDLVRMGFRVPLSRLFTAPMAAARYLERRGTSRCKLLLREEVASELSAFERSDVDAEAVVIGDIGQAWSYDVLNEVFGLVMKGAELVALHRNRFWRTERGLMLDIGAFVAGLEYATGKRARIVGKPSRDYFEAGFARLELDPREVAMIGDDVDTDVGAAQALGAVGVLVRTGKYDEGYVSASAVKPDLIIDSIAELDLERIS